MKPNLVAILLSVAFSSQVAAHALATPSAANSPAQTYSALQTAWDDCFEIKSTCAELLDEGRFAPARQKWVAYYASTLAQSVADMQTALAGVAAASNAALQIGALQAPLAQLQKIAGAMKTPTDDKYPAAFWDPTRQILSAADDLDKSLVSTLAVLDNSGVTPALQPTPTATAGGTTLKLHGHIGAGTGSLDGLVQAAKKVDDVCLHMAAELDRLNLSIGKAPTQPLKDEMYQGAFTKQEILSQYKYMPNFVFTTDPSVARFTYREPPRRNMLVHYLQQLDKLLNLMDSEMVAIQSSLTPAQQGAIAGPWEAMKQKYVDARNQYMTLYNLLQKATDAQLAQDIRGDQTVYGKPVMAIRDDMTQLRTAINDFVAIAGK